MRRMTEEDENTMTIKFRLAMDDELEKHRRQMTIQWSEFSSVALMRRAQGYLCLAFEALEQKKNMTTRKHLAHVGNYLAMAFDNLGSQQEAPPQP